MLFSVKVRFLYMFKPSQCQLIAFVISFRLGSAYRNDMHVSRLEILMMLYENILHTTICHTDHTIGIQANYNDPADDVNCTFLQFCKIR